MASLLRNSPVFCESMGMDREIVPLSASEEAFWRTFARAMLVIPRLLDTDQQLNSGMTSGEYGVLMHLSESPERRMRINELAQKVALSPSRISRIVAELTRGGFATRETSTEDRRGQIVTLTDAGFARLEEAWPEHLLSVRARVMDHIDPAELPKLTETLGRMVGSTSKAELDCGPDEDC
jgi:DNA-binding MarR family transcriptional regulator